MTKKKIKKTVKKVEKTALEPVKEPDIIQPVAKGNLGSQTAELT